MPFEFLNKIRIIVMQGEKQKKENNNSTWSPYLAGAAACIVAGPYVGACICAASLFYQKKQSAEPEQSHQPKP